MKALETSASTTAIATAKNALRDAPAASAITVLHTIAELKAAWDTSYLVIALTKRRTKCHI